VTRLAIVNRESSLESALALGRSALAWVESESHPALDSSAVSGEALVLGRLQREDTLRERSPARFDVAIERRVTTGTEAQVSGAALYHALALPRVDALFPDASARTLLNRNLRALLRGYTAAGVPLRYFGTEVLALLGHPVALVGYERNESGAVLIEVLIGLEAPCVVRSALKREPAVALYSILRSEPAPFELLERAVRGVVERLGVSSFEIDLPMAAGAPVLESEPVQGSVPIPLGVVEATGTRITGDLLVGTAALGEVEERARAALDANQPLTAAVLEPLQGAPLDGARPADLLQALEAAFSARSIAPRTP
jgi:hypothetical protein